MVRQQSLPWRKRFDVKLIIVSTVFVVLASLIHSGVTVLHFKQAYLDDLKQHAHMLSISMRQVLEILIAEQEHEKLETYIRDISGISGIKSLGVYDRSGVSVTSVVKHDGQFVYDSATVNIDTKKINAGLYLSADEVTVWDPLGEGGSEGWLMLELDGSEMHQLVDERILSSIVEDGTILFVLLAGIILYMRGPFLYLNRAAAFARQMVQEPGEQIELYKAINEFHVLGDSLNQASTTLLRKSNHNRKILDTLNDQKRALDEHSIVSITNSEGIILYANQRFVNVSLYSESELLGQPHSIVNSGFHPSEFFADLWQRIQFGKVWRGEICNRRKDGKLYWVDTTIVPFLDYDQIPYQYVAIRTEITHLKEVEASLLSRTLTIQHSQEAGKLGTWEVDVAAKTVRLSDFAAHLLGVKLTSSEPMSIVDILQQSNIVNRDQLSVCFQSLLSDNVIDVEIALVNPDQEITWVYLKGERLDSEVGTPSLVGIIQDVTERRLAAEEKEAVSRILDQTKDGILVLPSLNEPFTYVNSGACAYSGYGKKELLNMNIADLDVNFNAERISDIENYLQRTDNHIFSFDADHRTKAGINIPVEVSIQKVRSGNTENFLVFVRDISEKLEAKRQLEDIAKFPEQNPAPILRVSYSGTLMYANVAGEKFISDYRELYGESFSNKIATHVRETNEINLRKEMEITCGKRVFSCLLVAYPEENYFNMYARDITDRIEIEKDLETRALQQGMLGEIGSFVLSMPMLNELFSFIVKKLFISMDINMVEILEFTSEGAFTRHAHIGWHDVEKGVEDITVGVALERFVRQEERTLLIELLSQDTRFSDVQRFRDEEVSSGLVVKVQGDVRSWGVIAVYSRKPVTFSNEDNQFLSAVASSLGMAIERDAARQILESTNSKLNFLLEASPVVIYSMSFQEDWCFNYISENLMNLLGYSVSDLTQRKNWSSIVHVDDLQELAAFYQRMTQAQASAIEIRMQNKQGQFRWIRNEIKRVFSTENLAENIVGSISDITDLKLAEQELIGYRDHLQEMVDDQTRDLVVARDAALSGERTMSTFLANMSHELRTPLHAIISFATFGIKKLDTDTKEKIHAYFEEIKDSGDQLLELVNELLDLSKLKAGRMVYSYQVSDLQQLAEGVVKELRLLAQEKQIQIQLLPVKESIRVEIDKDRIKQVVRNLISNAIKFSPENTEIEVVLEDTDTSVFLKVYDQGVGIPEEELGSIFNAFEQSSSTRNKAGGTGLGLSISREIVQSGHKGRIYAENRPKGGAVLTIELPKVD